MTRESPAPSNTAGDVSGSFFAEQNNAQVVNIWANILGVLTSVAGTNTITANAAGTLKSYTRGLIGVLEPVNTNTGAVQINIDGLGNKALRTSGNSALTAGDIVAGKAYTIFYDGTAFRVLDAGDEFIRFDQVSRYAYVLPEATDGAVATTGSWQDYPLNAVPEDGIAGTSLASSTMTLPAGDYEIEAEIIVHGREIDGLLRLYNDTDGVDVTTISAMSRWADDAMHHANDATAPINGVEGSTYSTTEPSSSVTLGTPGGADSEGTSFREGTSQNFMVRQNRSVVLRLAGTVSIDAAKDFKLQFFLGTRTKSGSSNRAFLGRAIDVTGYSETYGWVKVTRKTTPATVRELVYGPTDMLSSVYDPAGKASQVAVESEIREKLTANRTYYVDVSSGSDSNDGLSSGAGAFATIEKALETAIDTLDFNGYDVDISVADGTHTASINVAGPQVGKGQLSLTGNTSTPANCLIDHAGSYDFILTQLDIVIDGFKIEGGVGIAIGFRCKVVLGTAMDFGVCANWHIEVGSQVRLELSGHTISGGASRHVFATAPCDIFSNGSTFTLTGTPAFASAFVDITSTAYCRLTSVTFSGSATGKRFNVIDNAVINTNGAGPSALPGDSAGTEATGGRYK